MKVLLKTADGLEVLSDIQKFTTEVKRPILKAFYRDGEKVGHTVIAVRFYNYVGNRIIDDMPIYEEYWYANNSDENR